MVIISNKEGEEEEGEERVVGRRARRVAAHGRKEMGRMRNTCTVAARRCVMALGMSNEVKKWNSLDSEGSKEGGKEG